MNETIQENLQEAVPEKEIVPDEVKAFFLKYNKAGGKARWEGKSEEDKKEFAAKGRFTIIKKSKGEQSAVDYLNKKYKAGITMKYLEKWFGKDDMTRLLRL
jgi:hypothetical protein